MLQLKKVFLVKANVKEATTSTEEEIRYMKIRLIRLASEEWHLTIEEAADLFAKNEVFHYIRDCYGIFHVEGDYAVLEDIKSFLKSKGVIVND